MSQYVPKAVLDTIFTDLEMIQELPFSMFDRITFNRKPFSMELSAKNHFVSINSSEMRITCNVATRTPFVAYISFDNSNLVTVSVDRTGNMEPFSFNSNGDVTGSYHKVQKESTVKIQRLMQNVAERIKKRLSRVDFL